MNQSVFDIITERLTNERLDEALLQNEEYLKVMDNINQLEDQISECGVSDDVKRLIGSLEGEYLTQNSCYGKISYQKGFCDCAALLTEIGLLKQPNDYRD